MQEKFKNGEILIEPKRAIFPQPEGLSKPETETIHQRLEVMFKSSHTNPRNRCNSPKHRQYKDYGGRGIKVCPEWDTDYPEFRRSQYQYFATSQLIHEKYNPNEGRVTIDRRDVDGDYTPENTGWSTPKVQSVGKRSTKEFFAIDPDGYLYYARGQVHFAEKESLNRTEKEGLNHKKISACLLGNQKTHKDWVFWYPEPEDVLFVAWVLGHGPGYVWVQDEDLLRERYADYIENDIS